MADPKDAPSPAGREESSSVDAVFQRVDSWGLEALGRSGESAVARPAAEVDLLPRSQAQPLSGWSLFEAAAADHAEAVTAAAAAQLEPEQPAPSIAEIYSAHERSHDSAGHDNPFVDPASLMLATNGAPALEPANASLSAGSLAALSQPRAASSGDRAAGPAMATSAVLGTGDAILSNGASLYQDGQAGQHGEAARGLWGVWSKLWRY